MNKAEKFLKTKGIKNKPIDSGIGTPENNNRYRVSDSMIDFHKEELQKLNEFVLNQYKIAGDAHFKATKELEKYDFSARQCAYREIGLEITNLLNNLK